MITEIAIITIDPTNAAAFESAVQKAAPLFRAAQGCRSMALERVIAIVFPDELYVQFQFPR